MAIKNDILFALVLRTIKERELAIASEELNVHLGTTNYAGTFTVFAMASKDGEGQDTCTYYCLFGRQFFNAIIAGDRDGVMNIVNSCLDTVLRFKAQPATKLEVPSVIYRDAVLTCYPPKDSEFEFEQITTINARHKATGMILSKSGTDWTGRKQKDSIKNEVINALAILTERFRPQGE